MRLAPFDPDPPLLDGDTDGFRGRLLVDGGLFPALRPAGRSFVERRREAGRAVAAAMTANRLLTVSPVAAPGADT